LQTLNANYKQKFRKSHTSAAAEKCALTYLRSNPTVFRQCFICIMFPHLFYISSRNVLIVVIKQLHLQLSLVL